MSRYLRLGAGLALGSLFLLVSAPATAEETALDRYVKKPDPTYAWTVAREVKGDGLTQWVVDLKSQTWRTEKDVNRPVWEHWLTVVKPDSATSNRAISKI